MIKGLRVFKPGALFPLEFSHLFLLLFALSKMCTYVGGGYVYEMVFLYSADSGRSTFSFIFLFSELSY